MKVSTLSFGASSLGAVFKTTDDSESVMVVRRAIQQGINYIDTAPWYGQGRSERVLGMALKDVPREAFYIATKVGRYEQDIQNMFDFTRDRVVRSVKESLDRLGLDYIDVIQVHDIEFCLSLEQLVLHTLPALHQLKLEGKVRYIGVTGYSLGVLQRLVELLPDNYIDTVLTYCRCTLFDRTLLGSAMDFFNNKKIGIINASPVSMGLLTTRGPPSWHPATTDIKSVCTKAAELCKEEDQDITDLAILWTLDQENIPTTLISTASRVNLDKNLDLARSCFSEEQRRMVARLEREVFRYMTNVHWECLEVARYWQQMLETGATQPKDI